MSTEGSNVGPIEEKEEFEDTPKGWYERWDKELSLADRRRKTFKKRAKKAVNRYQDVRSSTEEDHYKLNLFNSNITVLESMLYGKVPHVDVSRRNADADDDVARVASEMLSRILNTDIEESGDTFRANLRHALHDRLVPGCGAARARYEIQTEDKEIDPLLDDAGEEIAEGYTQTKVISEECVTDYVQWDDLRWGYARIWEEVPWIAIRSYLTKDQVKKRFPKANVDDLEYKAADPLDDKASELSAEMKDSWEKAQIWEIWVIEEREVHWYSHGAEELLDRKDDPLKLQGFWPMPEFMLANPNTTTFMPVPDFYISQDLYNKIDELETRINIITDAVKVIGLYDESNPEIQRMFKEGVDNDLIPVKNWAAYAEKGGLDGAVDWFPIKDVVESLVKLQELRDEKIRLLYQVTGLSDILRGEATGTGRVSATEQGLKAKFASVRVQALQDRFAVFASELASIKAEVICKHFDAETIVKQSNIQYTADGKDPQLIQGALQLLKSPDMGSWRIEIRPESVAMTDFAQLQNERTEFINALAVFLQSSAPVVEALPGSAGVLMELLKWGLAGFKGSQQIEGVIDRAIDQLQKNPIPSKKEPEDRTVELEALKHKNKILQEQLDHKHDVTEEQLQHENRMKELGLTGSLKAVEKEIETVTNLEQKEGETAMDAWLEEIKGEQSAKKLRSGKD